MVMFFSRGGGGGGGRRLSSTSAFTVLAGLSFLAHLARLALDFLRHSIYKNRMKFVNLDTHTTATTATTTDANNVSKLQYLDEFLDKTFLTDYFLDRSGSFDSTTKSNDSISPYSHSHSHSHSQ